MPVQEPGTRPARPIPYRVNITASADLTAEVFTLKLINTGSRTAVFHVRSANPLQSPRSYTVGPKEELADTWQFATTGLAPYDLSVYGPNGFFRHYRGAARDLTAINLESGVIYDVHSKGVVVSVKNAGSTICNVQLKNVYDRTASTHSLHPGAVFETFVSLTKHAGWYDFIFTVESDITFQQQIAGHLEANEPSTTDPAIS